MGQLQFDPMIAEVQEYCNKVKFLSNEEIEKLHRLLSEIDAKLAELDSLPGEDAAALTQLRYDLVQLQETIADEQEKTQQEILNLPGVKHAFCAYTNRIANSTKE